MRRDNIISIRVDFNEKETILKNVKSSGARSMSDYLRKKGLENGALNPTPISQQDMSLKAIAAMLLYYIRGIMKDDGTIVKDSLDWEAARKKYKKDTKKTISLDLVGMDAETKKKFLQKVDETLETAKELHGELEAILEIRKKRLEKKD